MAGASAAGGGWRSARILSAALVALTALAMILVVGLAIRTVEVERSQREQARLTSEIIDELREIDRAALNGETGQRGYMLSLDRRYLQPYFTGRDHIEPALRRLRHLIGPGATPRQVKLLDEIEEFGGTTLDITAAASRITAPWLIVHGRDDETVPWAEAEDLARAASGEVTLRIVDGANHTFGAKHPVTEPGELLRHVTAESVEFFVERLARA